jgi:hypothetical protein
VGGVLQQQLLQVKERALVVDPLPNLNGLLLTFFVE